MVSWAKIITRVTFAFIAAEAEISNRSSSGLRLVEMSLEPQPSFHVYLKQSFYVEIVSNIVSSLYMTVNDDECLKILAKKYKHI